MSVLEWWNSFPIAAKILIGLTLLAIACIIAAATGGAGAGALAAVGNVLLNFMIGLASDLAITVVMAFLTGGDVADALIHGLADGVFFGGLFAFVSAGINAVKAGVRSVYNAKFLGRSQTGAQPCSTVNYPPNNGAVPGSEEVINLAPGKYGRYGKIMEKSNYITDVGVSASQLSLPPWNNSVYTEITVVKTIPNVVKSTVAPWIEWNGVGGGVQYMLPMSIMELKNLGYIVF